MALHAFIESHRNIVVLTGAGVSTASGIPDYRDLAGNWKQAQPMHFKDFLSSEHARQRYWARSALGRERFREARPNAAHIALARLQTRGKISSLITQNVDGLHQAAGSRNVVELHGSLDNVVCLGCHSSSPRESVQDFLTKQNPFLRGLSAARLADGDVQLEDIDFTRMRIPDCESCGGILKPDVVFYGEGVPRQRVQACFDAVDRADAMLVVGSSLMVYSGFRFVRYAAEKTLPVMALNLGATRADNLLTFKLNGDCVATLANLFE